MNGGIPEMKLSLVIVIDEILGGLDWGGVWKDWDDGWIREVSSMIRVSMSVLVFIGVYSLVWFMEGWLLKGNGKYILY